MNTRPTSTAGFVSLDGAPRGGRLQAFMERSRSYTSLPRHAHTPDFRMIPVESPAYRDTFRWILDGNQKIGLLNLSFGEIELLRFFPPEDGALVDYAMPEIYSWIKLRGVRLTIVPQGSKWDQGNMAYPQDRGERLHLSYSETMSDGTQIVRHFILRFDAVLGYVLDCSFTMAMDVPRQFEYGNLLAGGLSESRDACKRYQKCIWARRDGAFCYQYQSPLSLMQYAGAEWNDMPEGGFVGWVAERDMNPFVEVTQSTPTCFETCDQWYDQHLFGKPPQEKGADGRYHIEAQFRLLSLPLPLAKELEDAARYLLPIEPGSARIGFLQGVVNDFETPIPAGTLYNGCLWKGQSAYDTAVGHSGTRSLRVEGGRAAEPIGAGTSIFVERGKRYRLGGWVRTRGVTGKGAFLRLKEVFWSWQDVRAEYATCSLTGDTDWTRLELEFEPVTYDPIVVPGLVVEGTGTAWFDDLALVEIPRVAFQA